MKTSMLAYSKLILEKVSFSRELFEREYKKALNSLSTAEARELREWLTGDGKKLVPVYASI